MVGAARHGGRRAGVSGFQRVSAGRLLTVNLLQAIAWTVLLYLLLAADMREPFFLKMCHGGILYHRSLYPI